MCRQRTRTLRSITVWILFGFTLLMGTYPGLTQANPPNEPVVLRNQTIRAGEPTPSSEAINAPSTISRAPSPVDPASSSSRGSIPSVSIDSRGAGGVSEVSRKIELKGPTPNDIPSQRPSRSTTSTLTMFVALGSVLGIFWAVTQLLKRIQPKPSIRLPNEALEVLGSTPIGTNQQLLLLRFGNKVVLVSQQPGATSCLSEVTEPESVSILLAACGKSVGIKEANEPGRVSKLIEGLLRNPPRSRHTAS